jgi:protein-S-isoprenylcysteine O-methyltransferase Ste14
MERNPMKGGRSFLFCLATLLMYLGWPLLGWGLDSLPQFFASSARWGYAGVVVLFSLAVGVQAYQGVEGIRGKSGEKEKLIVRQSIVRYILELSLYIALFFIPFFDRRSIGVFTGGAALRWVGVALCAIGYGLIFWSGVALGRQYSADVTIQENHHLITGNIYRYIRHPRYLGIMALSVGISLTFRSWIGLLATLFFLGLLIYRIRDEEAVMHKEFGAEWEAYCKCSWRLIPFIY